jgi:hypothetical protein
MKVILPSFLFLLLAHFSFAQLKDSIDWRPSVQVNNVPTFTEEKKIVHQEGTMALMVPSMREC